MATVTATQRLDMGALADLAAAILDEGIVASKGSTLVGVEYGEGYNSYLARFHGTGFNASLGQPFTGPGTVTSIELGDWFGFQYDLTISGFSVTLAQLDAAAHSADPLALSNLLFSGADTITGSSSAGVGEVLNGYGGADTINGDGGRDLLLGGLGNDLVHGGDEGDPYTSDYGDGIDGGDGDDQLFGDAGRDVVVGGKGADLINGGAGADVLMHGAATLSKTVVTHSFVVDHMLVSGPIEVWTAAASLIDDKTVDTLNGGDGDDWIGSGLGDHIDGGAGIDRLEVNFRSRPSSLVLTVSAASLAGAAGGSIANIELFSVRGTVQADQITGGTAADYLFGSGGGDTLRGNGGDDRLAGADDMALEQSSLPIANVDDGVQDTLDGGAGNDLVTVGRLDSGIGGSGTDTLNVVLRGLAQGVSLNLSGSDRWTLLAAATGGTLTGFEVLGALHATRFADVITVGGATSVYGYEGSDILTGDAAAQTLMGGTGNDQLYGLGGADTLKGGGGTDRLFGGAGDDRILGDELARGPEAGAGKDYIDGGEGADEIFAGGGDDTVIGGQGEDTMDGGAGLDILSYAGSLAAVTLSLSFMTDEQTPFGPQRVNAIYANGQGGDAQGDGAINFERFVGSNFDDTIIFVTNNWTTDFPNATLDGGKGNDTLGGSAGNEKLYGGEGADLLWGDAGNDFIDGGVGFDTASYLEAWSVTVDLRITGAQNTGSAGLDTIRGIEAVEGSYGDDVIHGNSAANQLTGSLGQDALWGEGGNDTLYGDGVTRWSEPDPEHPDYDPDTLHGGDGKDVLYGGGGGDQLWGDAGVDILYGEGGDDTLHGGADADKLYGGVGADTFVFQTTGESSSAAKDRIFDFNAAEGDVIDLSAIDANTALSGNQAFTMVSVWTGVAGQAKAVYWAASDYTTLMLDTNGDKAPDFALIINGNVTSGWVL
jgi:Ca2+-binding RTX toxin-like protein